MSIQKAQIEEWKEKHGTVYQLESGGKVGFIFDPSTKLSVMKMVVSSFMKGRRSTATESILNNCWLGGDEELKKEEVYRNALDEQIDELIDIPEYEIENKKDHALIIVKGRSLKVKYASRGDLKYAEQRNKQNKPFDENVYLLDRISLEDLAEIKQDTQLYLGYLIAVKEVKEQKYVTVKKL